MPLIMLTVLRDDDATTGVNVKFSSFGYIHTHTHEIARNDAFGTKIAWETTLSREKKKKHIHKCPIAIRDK